MKTTLHASLMSMLLLAVCAISSPVYADQVDADNSYADLPFDVSTSEWSSWDDNNFAWDTDDWSTWCDGICCENASRVYVGPVYFNRRLHFTNKHDTRYNILGVHGSSRAKGNFIGVNFGYEYKEICSLYGRVDAVWSTGTFKGCERNRTNDWFVDGRIGWTFGECSPCGWSVTPYTGIGYFWINRHFRNAPTSVKYESWYVPVGLLAEIEIMPDFTVGIDGTWMPEFCSRVSLNHHSLDEVNDRGNDNRYGWRIEVPFTYVVPCTIWDGWDLELVVAPFYQQFYYGHISHNVEPVVLGLPRSREDFWGAKFLIGVTF